MLMELFYNITKNKWLTDCKQPLVFGKNNLPILYEEDSSGVAFKVKRNKNKVGPVIAILTSKEGRQDFYGNRSTFKKIHHQLQQTGGILFVMTPEGYQGEEIDGFLFIEGEWRKACLPLPDIIYNRVASYRAEEKLDEIRKMALQNAIPLYNPHFFNKWETYKQLLQNDLCKDYLPDTMVMDDFRKFTDWIEKYQTLIVKPVLSNRGNGVYLVKKNINHIEVTSNKVKNKYSSYGEAWEALKSKLHAQTVIIQKHIALKQYLNRPYDLRILVQRVKEHWGVTGIGVRWAGQGSVTTHVPQGGSILPFETVSSGIDRQEIQKLAIQIANQLELAYGYLCEFSIDLGVDEANQLWIFEINSKPMQFDEPHIQGKALQTLIQCFYEDTGF
ncbi:YheC/YheD family protein [Anaerobacillus alkaliphilus]|uniref:YheC/YheD family protein n=1 Tax=Anaerobacillus alkaliphilus TaxID=1548597 RepID=A0A4Q0VS94_9BACI|nr:YheC/YheD family protein [Anaerobacillus alkaliphilus]RXI99868.1 YheC/YheD family protein [Anaerobacillus alkaliphilus]